MATNEEVKLLVIVGSPCVSRAEIGLKLKGIEYQYLQESVSSKSDLLLKYNPVYKKVPVLLHNEKAIAESLVIIEYVDETWKGHPILPSDSYHGALARFWSKFMDHKLLPTVFKAAFNPSKKEREKGVEESLKALHILENELKYKFFNGDSFGLVDIVGVFVAFWLPKIQEVGGLFKEFNTANFPKLHEWNQEILNHPIVKAVLPPRENLLAFTKSHFEGFVDSE